MPSVSRQKSSPSASGVRKVASVGVNCGRRLVKNTAIFALPRFETIPWRNAARGAQARGCCRDRRRRFPPDRAPQAAGAEPEEVGGAERLQREIERLRRDEDRGEAERGRDRPGREPAGDAAGGCDPGPPATAERVPDRERGVLARNDDHERRDGEEREHVASTRPACTPRRGASRSRCRCARSPRRTARAPSRAASPSGGRRPGRAPTSCSSGSRS